VSKGRPTVPGVRLEKYELVERIGSGGMATVWQALTQGAAGFRRPVAVKKMRPEFREVQDYIAMFVEEARVGAELNHPNIVQVHDFCQDAGGAYYLVMEWVEGTDLGSYTGYFKNRKRATEWDLVAAAGIGTLRGLSAAHERHHGGEPAPVIHRDVTPHNVMLGCTGVAKLADFGLALAKDRVNRMTAPGMVKGKISYIAPELLDGKDAEPRSDLFSMGICLWEALAGEKLFDAPNDLDVFRMIKSGRISSLSDYRSDLPGRLVALIERALAQNPEDRPASAASMAGELAEILSAHGVGDYQQKLAASVREVRDELRTKRAAAHEHKEISLASLVIDVSESFDVPG
jgi:serine/threonine-protein kinase